MTIVAARPAGVAPICAGLPVLQRNRSWPDAARMREAGRAIVGVLDGCDAERSALRHFAERAWQPITLLVLPAGVVPGARPTADALGFEIARADPSDPAAAARLRRGLRALLATDTWLVPLAADALGCHDAALVHVLTACVRLLPDRHTVASWAGVLGLEHRQALHTFFTDRGLPPPKRVLDHLRLACIAHHGRVDRPAPDRAALAERYGFSSADYLGKAVKRRLGCSVGELVDIGPTRALAGLRRDMRANA